MTDTNLMRSNKMIHRYLLVAGLIAALAACGTGAGSVKSSAKNLTPEEAVALRAVERWQKIIAGDLGSAYQFLTPGARRVQTQDGYVQRMAQAQVKWTDARVVRVVCEDAETCHADVQLDIEVNVPGMGATKINTSTMVEENWLASNGQWYFLPSQAR